MSHHHNRIYWEFGEDSLGELPRGEKELPAVLDRSDLPDKLGWIEKVEAALDEIRAGRLEKVVLARKTTLKFSSPIDPATLFSRLREKAAKTTARFFVQEGEHQAFLGATPELLFSREGRQLKTMALAGTAAKGGGFSEKERREVDYVLEGIGQALSPLTESIEIGPLRILESTNVRHLHYLIEAILHDHTTDAQLIEALHPTPAIGGWPKKPSLEFLEKHEPFSRGFYAAPIGFSTKERSFFAVGIRSARVDGEKLHLFAGAGIVDGSDPEQEWLELEAKISPFLEVVL